MIMTLSAIGGVSFHSEVSDLSGITTFIEEGTKQGR